MRLDLKKQRAVLEQSETRAILDPAAGKLGEVHELDLNTEHGPAAFDVDNRRSTTAMTLDQKMDEFLAKRQLYEELEERKKREYVRRFIEESYRMGYIVKINEALEIVSVKKRQ
jgi:hypothetical protein